MVCKVNAQHFLFHLEQILLVVVCCGWQLAVQLNYGACTFQAGHCKERNLSFDGVLCCGLGRIDKFADNCQLLSAADLKGKTVIPFATSGSSTIEKAVSALKTTYPNVKWQNGYLLNKPTNADIKKVVK